jgi:hypothetical protein
LSQITVYGLLIAPEIPVPDEKLAFEETICAGLKSAAQ